MVIMSMGLFLAVLAIAFPLVAPVWAHDDAPWVPSVAVMITLGSGLVVIATIGLVYLVRRRKGEKEIKEIIHGSENAKRIKERREGQDR